MTTPPTDRTTRRRYLSALVAVAGTANVAGCTSLWEQTGATDVIVHNVGEVQKTVSITITDTDVEERHTSRTVKLDPGENVDPVNRSKLPTNTSYAVEVAVDETTSETFEWDDPDVELAPLHVLVDDTRNVKFLLQAG